MAQDTDGLLLPDKLGNFAKKLTEEGEHSAGMDLFRTLLDVSREEEGRAQSRWGFDLWHYQRILDLALPPLVLADPCGAFNVLSDLLESAVKSHDRGLEDYSQAWRPAIADHPQNELTSIEDTLVTAVRDSAAPCLHGGTEAVTLMRELEDRGYPVFRRLALHVLQSLEGKGLRLAEERLEARANLLDRRLLPEYAFLLRSSFGRLSPESQGRLLGSIDQGPDINVAKYEKNHGHTPSDSDLERYRRHWQFEKLGFIEASLTGTWLDRYQEFLLEFGRPERPPEFTFWITSWTGPTSPMDK